jgi:hypothetical protein
VKNQEKIMPPRTATKAKPSVILLEFNELSPRLMNQFMAQGKLPNFTRLHGEAQVYVTETEEEPPYLEPWIQWVNVHSGLSYEDHKIFRLDEGQKLKVPCLWDILSKEGHRVGVCGSMNVRYQKPFNGYVLPDPWSTMVEPFPASLKTYFNFVQKNVMEHTRNRVPLSKAEYLGFLRFMLRSGLSANTVSASVRQLLSERTSRTHWKRAVILDRLQFDLFAHYWNQLKPEFSTFFLNSTAHFQHMYWRNMEPEHFKMKPGADEQSVFEDAVLFGYQEMDRLVGRFLKLCGPTTTLIFCTALGQQPCLTYEEEGGKCFHRPKDFEELLAFAGVTTPHEVSPMMSEHFHVYFQNEEDAITAQVRLSSLRLNGEQVLMAKREKTVLTSGCWIFHAVPHDAMLTRPSRSVPFFDIFYRAEGTKSGMHDSDGMLWIRYPDAAHRIHGGKVGLTSIAPTILDLFHVTAPAYMKGSSLLATGRRSSASSYETAPVSAA